jgi:hypothetical protein
MDRINIFCMMSLSYRRAIRYFIYLFCHFAASFTFIKVAQIISRLIININEISHSQLNTIISSEINLLPMPFQQFLHNFRIVLFGLFLGLALVLFPSQILIQFLSRLVRTRLTIIFLFELSFLGIPLSRLHVQCPKL